jgi:hypothetical protein
MKTEADILRSSLISSLPELFHPLNTTQVEQADQLWLCPAAQVTIDHQTGFPNVKWDARSPEFASVHIRVFRTSDDTFIPASTCNYHGCGQDVARGEQLLSLCAKEESHGLLTNVDITEAARQFPVVCLHEKAVLIELLHRLRLSKAAPSSLSFSHTPISSEATIGDDIKSCSPFFNFSPPPPPSPLVSHVKFLKEIRDFRFFSVFHDTWAPVQMGGTMIVKCCFCRNPKCKHYETFICKIFTPLFPSLVDYAEHERAAKIMSFMYVILLRFFISTPKLFISSIHMHYYAMPCRVLI